MEILDRGGYTRYDFKTATKLLEVNRALVDRYHGDLNALHEAAAGPLELERDLKALGKGVGDVTVRIFLRELRGIWPKAKPPLSELALSAARELGFLRPGPGGEGRALSALIGLWAAEGNRVEEFADFEAALVRCGLRLRRSGARRKRGSGEAATAGRRAV